MIVYGGILAGGIGSRMSQSGVPKQFMDVGGVPVFVRTLRRFLEMEELAGIVVAMHADWCDYAREILDRHKLDMSRIDMVDGGSTRFESLVNLAIGCRESAGRVGYSGRVLMINHDCARPFVSMEILKRNVSMMKEGGVDMVTTSIPTIDTVLLSRNGSVGDCVPERSTVFLDQGPQTVDVGHFLDLVDALSETERGRYMEAGRLYMEKGFKVGIAPGNRYNFKLTTPFDMAVAEKLLSDKVIA
jgi:2-C-methyl-D-erythritol 4-phosphate cytidylyltransferase